MTKRKQHNIELDATAKDEITLNVIREMAKSMSDDLYLVDLPKRYSPKTAYHLQVSAAAKCFADSIADLAVTHGKDPGECWENIKRMGDMALQEDQNTVSETVVP